MVSISEKLRCFVNLRAYFKGGDKMKKIKVLFVDDELNVLNAIKRITLLEDFESLFSMSGEKALEEFENNEIAVIVTDMRMPKMNGLDLLEKVKEISPNTVRMVLSGYAQMSQVIATVNKVGVFKYITKPWNNEEEFLPAIHEAIKYYNLVDENEAFKIQLLEKNKLYQKILNMNNDLIKNSQKDISYIKAMTKVIFDIKNNMYELLKDECPRQKTLSEQIDKVYFQYLETVPSVIEVFNLNAFKDGFDELKKNNVAVVFDDQNVVNINYLGNRRVLELIFSKVLEVITWKAKKEELILNIKNIDTLKLNLFVKNKDAFNSIINDKESMLILNFLDAMGKIFGGKVTVVPEKFVIIINTALKIMD
jgi:YesN/AraC family two-component response regulator